MEKEEVFKIGSGFREACVDYPFEKDAQTAVFRRKDNRKWFGIYLYVPKKYFGEGEGGEFCLNLKCPIDLIFMLCESHDTIFPAWHMNKRHWITVRLRGADSEELAKLFALSYELCASKQSRQGRSKKL